MVQTFSRGSESSSVPIQRCPQSGRGSGSVFAQLATHLIAPGPAPCRGVSRNRPRPWRYQNAADNSVDSKDGLEHVSCARASKKATLRAPDIKAIEITSATARHADFWRGREASTFSEETVFWGADPPLSTETRGGALYCNEALVSNCYYTISQPLPLQTLRKALTSTPAHALWHQRPRHALQDWTSKLHSGTPVSPSWRVMLSSRFSGDELFYCASPTGKPSHCAEPHRNAMIPSLQVLFSTGSQGAGTEHRLQEQ